MSKRQLFHYLALVLLGGGASSPCPAGTCYMADFLECYPHLADNRHCRADCASILRVGLLAIVALAVSNQGETPMTQ